MLKVITDVIDLEDANHDSYSIDCIFFLSKIRYWLAISENIANVLKDLYNHSHDCEHVENVETWMYLLDHRCLHAPYLNWFTLS